MLIAVVTLPVSNFAVILKEASEPAVSVSLKETPLTEGFLDKAKVQSSDVPGSAETFAGRVSSTITFLKSKPVPFVTVTVYVNGSLSFGLAGATDMLMVRPAQ